MKGDNDLILNLDLEKNSSESAFSYRAREELVYKKLGVKSNSFSESFNRNSISERSLT